MNSYVPQKMAAADTTRTISILMSNMSSLFSTNRMGQKESKILSLSMKQFGKIQKSMPMWKIANQTMALTTAVAIQTSENVRKSVFATYKENKGVPRNIPNSNFEPFGPHAEQEEEESQCNTGDEPQLRFNFSDFNLEDIEAVRGDNHVLKRKNFD